jgi:hypothetical protein
VLVVVDAPPVVVVEALVVPVVVVVGAAVVVVAPQLSASQQLATPLTTHAFALVEPWHRLASFLMLHLERPVDVVRRQTTAPGRPHVDLLAHFTTALRQLAESSPRSTAVVATARTQWT